MGARLSIDLHGLGHCYASNLKGATGAARQLTPRQEALSPMLRFDPVRKNMAGAWARNQESGRAT